MNKKLLLLSVALLAFATSFAQKWDRPVATGYRLDVHA